jgi:hypothetical protein
MHHAVPDGLPPVCTAYSVGLTDDGLMLLLVGDELAELPAAIFAICPHALDEFVRELKRHRPEALRRHPAAVDSDGRPLNRAERRAAQRWRPARR